VNWSPKLEVTKHTVGINISIIHSSHVSTVWNCSVPCCSGTMHPIYRMVYGYPPVTAFYIFCQQIHLREFFEVCCTGSVFSLQYSVYFMLLFLVHNIFTFCIKDAWNLNVQISCQRVNCVYTWMYVYMYIC